MVLQEAGLKYGQGRPPAPDRAVEHRRTCRLKPKHRDLSLASIALQEETVALLGRLPSSADHCESVVNLGQALRSDHGTHQGPPPAKLGIQHPTGPPSHRRGHFRVLFVTCDR